MSIESIDVLSDRQVEQLHAFYQNEWWTKGRELEDVRRMLTNTSLIVAFAESADGRLIAFARVLTDFSYHALIFDVIAAPEARSQGWGRRLMDAILEHPRLKKVPAFWLCCLPEMVPFYKKWGFESELGELKWMRCVPARPRCERIAE